MTQKVSAATVSLLVAAALGAGGCATRKPTVASRPPASSAVGRSLALEAPTLDGSPVRLAPESGKVRVVDLWASWCDPCRDALPHLDAIARELGPRGVEVYGVAVDDDREEVLAFLAEVRVEFPILWDRSGTRASAAGLPILRLPTTLIVDRRGTIRFVHEGWTERVAREQRSQVEALLRE
jgi:thiol-disulfide isomerase/thioredoxin